MLSSHLVCMFCGSLAICLFNNKSKRRGQKAKACRGSPTITQDTEYNKLYMHVSAKLLNYINTYTTDALLVTVATSVKPYNQARCRSTEKE